MRYTRHATRRMREMRLSRDEVEEVFNTAESLDYPSPPSHPPGRRIRVYGDLAVVYEGSTVISVLWNGKTSREELVR